MKSNKLLNLLGIIVFALAIAVFVAPVGNGITAALKVASGIGVPTIEWTGYTVIFGNWADGYIQEACAANIAAFTLVVIGVAFQLIATILLFPNPKGSKKFSGFLFILGGLLEAIFGILFLCCEKTTGLADNASIKALYDLKLGIGTIISSAAAIVAAVLSIGTGVLAWKKK